MILFTVTYYASALQRLNSGDDPSTAFIRSSEAALAGAESTKNMQPQVTIYIIVSLRELSCFINFVIISRSNKEKLMQAGRSMYVSRDILATVPDPGAMAAASWYRAAALVVKEKYKK